MSLDSVAAEGDETEELVAEAETEDAFIEPDEADAAMLEATAAASIELDDEGAAVEVDDEGSAVEVEVIVEEVDIGAASDVLEKSLMTSTFIPARVGEGVESATEATVTEDDAVTVEVEVTVIVVVKVSAAVEVLVEFESVVVELNVNESGFSSTSILPARGLKTIVTSAVELGDESLALMLAICTESVSSPSDEPATLSSTSCGVASQSIGLTCPDVELNKKSWPEQAALDAGWQVMLSELLYLYVRQPPPAMSLHSNLTTEEPWSMNIVKVVASVSLMLYVRLVWFQSNDAILLPSLSISMYPGED